ncbi:unnamed protein product, partial [Rotaria magnacalcarata]
FYSPYHAAITLCLNNIGCTLDQQKKYAEALHCYQHPLKINQKLYASGHPNMAYTLNNIGNILCQQKSYKDVLEYYHQAFNIRERFYPFEHVDIVDSLNNIGITYMEMIEPKISHNYLQRTWSQY